MLENLRKKCLFVKRGGFESSCARERRCVVVDDDVVIVNLARSLSERKSNGALFFVRKHALSGTFCFQILLLLQGNERSRSLGTKKAEARVTFEHELRGERFSLSPRNCSWDTEKKRRRKKNSRSFFFSFSTSSSSSSFFLVPASNKNARTTGK